MHTSGKFGEEIATSRITGGNRVQRIESCFAYGTLTLRTQSEHSCIVPSGLPPRTYF